MKAHYFILSLICLFFSLPINTNAQSTPDPGLPGIYAVSKDTFDLGALAYKPDSFPNFVELRGSVHYPASLVGGPFPVILLLHGRHVTVYKTASPGTVSLSWPPVSGFQSIISFDGYDYFAKTMASHGYIVISVSCNAINAADASLPDLGMNARAQLLQKHLDLWKGYNTTGGAPFGSKFIGKLDMKHIGTMGHSRGGEGVIFHALLNKSLGSPYGIKAVITLAPIDFSRKVLNDIPLMNIAPYCDGDVTSLNGVHFYDDARYNVATDEAPKHSVLLMGANHNFFNTVWTPGSYIAGGSDDWDGSFGSVSDVFCSSKRPGNGRFDTASQKAAFNAYGAAFFRMYVGGDTTFAPILEVDDIYPPASSKMHTSDVYVSYHPGNSKRRDINRVDTDLNLSINTLSGPVTQSGLVSSTICGGGLLMASCNVGTTQSMEPHKGSSAQKGMMQTALRWNDTTDFYQNEIPDSYKNISGYLNLSFRAAVNFKSTRPVGRDLDFTVQLEDSFGKISNQLVSKNSGALFYQPGNTPSYLPKVLFNTIKIPLAQFNGINQTKIKFVRFLFNAADSGALLISDIALTGIDPKPCGLTDAKFKDSLGKSYTVYFSDSSTINSNDSIIYSWHFADPISGIKDTSGLKNPIHIFTASGVYNICLYLSAYRKNGLVCTDTFCRTLTLLPNRIVSQNISHISLSPNPASNFIMINGALPEDIFQLRNLCGQTVLNTNITTPKITLPSNLPNGIYIAIIHTQKGNIIQKLVIEH